MKLTQTELELIHYALITYSFLTRDEADDLHDKIRKLNNYSIVPEEDTFTAYGKKEDWSEQ